jgi:hypothetical protein
MITRRKRDLEDQDITKIVTMTSMIINRESKDVVAVMMTMTTMILMIHIEDADIPDDATTRNSQKVLNYLTYLSHLISSSIQLSITMVAITVNVEMMDTIAAEVVVMDHHLLQMETSSLISIGIQVAYAQLGMT